MPSYSGVWNLVSQLQAYAAQNWPQGPGAPTSVSATAGDSQATITFTAPTFTGVPPGITGYLATSSPGGFTATGASSPLTVTGLTNGTSYTFNVQATNGVQYGPAGTSGSVTPAQLQRGLFGGGYGASGQVNVIDYINIASAGNAVDFGDLTIARFGVSAYSSSTRGVWAGGEAASNTNVIDYVTIASIGNATDFGDLLNVSGYTGISYLTGCSNQTRGVSAGGQNSGGRINTIQYVTIASTGNATNFGSLSNNLDQAGACASSTRGLFAGGFTSVRLNTIEYITISSTGDAADFGDLTQITYGLAGCSSSTRGLFAAGNNDVDGNLNIIGYVTIASTGNAIDFGDLLYSQRLIAATSSSLRGVFCGGTGENNTINYVTIATTGNATDFGDLSVGRYALAGCSNCHGGL